MESAAPTAAPSLAVPAEGLARAHAQGRPWVTLKAGVSLDGKIATRTGESQWITGPEARALGHALRGARAGIVAGIGTVVADDPLLTARGGGGPSPVRVVLDATCRIDPRARCLADDGVRRVVVCGSGADAGRMAALRTQGVEVWREETPRPVPGAFLPRLLASGVDTLLVEGGGRVHANLIANGAADEIFLFVAGTVIGGQDAPGWCASLGVDVLAAAPRLNLSPPRRVGADVLLHGFFVRSAGP